METLVNFDERIKRHRKIHKMKKTIFGILALTAGFALLGFNLEIINPEYKHIVFSWQSLLIALGLINISDKESISAGAILIIVGTFFMFPELINVPFKLKQVFWPVIIITVGFLILTKRLFFRKSSKTKNWKHMFDEKKISEFEISDSGKISETNIFSGSKRIFDYPVFNGGRISNIFGGTEIDLRNTKLAEGRVILEIENIFGGTTLLVPSEWIIHIEVENILGGFTDKRYIKPKKEEDFNGNELVIKGSCVFGGGELKSV